MQCGRKCAWVGTVVLLVGCALSAASLIEFSGEARGADPATGSEARSAVTHVPVFRIVYDDASHFFKSERGDSPTSIGILMDALVRSPASRAAVLKGLKSDDPAEAEFAANALQSAGDFEIIPHLLECAERYTDEEDVVRSVIDAVYSVTFNCTGRYVNVPGSERIATKESIAALRKWLASREDERKDSTYEEYWGGEAIVGLKAVNAGDSYNGGNYFIQSLTALTNSADAQRSAPVLVRLISKVDTSKDDAHSLMKCLLVALQLYVGPLSLPKNDSAAEQQRAQQAILKWWQQNRHKKPVWWYLGTLADRGYATGNPADVPNTARALIRALHSRNEPERHAANMVLALALPHGEELVVDCTGVFVPDPENRPNPNPTQQYLRQLVLFKAYQFYVVRSGTYAWDEKEGKYRPN